jgi:ribosomal protein S3
MPIDYKRANCRLRYGVCGIRVWVLQMRPTYQAMKAYHKNYSYFRVIRAARAARKAKNREYDLQVKYKKKRQRRIKRKNQGRCTTLIKSIKKIEYI